MQEHHHHKFKEARMDRIIVDSIWLKNDIDSLVDWKDDVVLVTNESHFHVAGIFYYEMTSDAIFRHEVK